MRPNELTASVPNTSARDRILEAAVAELAENGSEFFRTTKLCEDLFVTRSLINHHFGNQSALIAEAAVVSYERYVEHLRESAIQASTPRARLEAWMIAQAQWHQENRGTAALLQMPHPKYAQLMSERFAARLQQGFRFNMAVLASLVTGVLENRVTSISFGYDEAPFGAMLSEDMNMLMRTASVGMSSLGASVWLAGQEMPSRAISENYLQDASLTQHSKWVIRAIIATQ